MSVTEGLSWIFRSVVISHWVVVLMVAAVAAAVCWVDDERVMSFATLISKDALFAVWWIGVGLLNSFGFGAGVLILLCHILKVCTSAQAYGNFHFDTRTIFWPPTYNSQPFHQLPSPAVGYIYHIKKLAPSLVCHIDAFLDSEWLAVIPHLEYVNFSGILRIVLPPVLLWGFGTVLGEVLTYLSAYTARETKSERDWLSVAISSALHRPTTSRLCCTRFTAALHRRYVSFLSKFGILALLIVPIFPKAVFNMCGLVCGYTLMPFCKFLVPFWLAKGVFKVVMLTCVSIFLSCERYDSLTAQSIREVIEVVGVKYIGINDPVAFEQSLLSMFEEWRRDTLPAKLYNIILPVFTAIFCVSMINRLAQVQQTRILTRNAYTDDTADQCSQPVVHLDDRVDESRTDSGVALMTLSRRGKRVASGSASKDETAEVDGAPLTPKTHRGRRKAPRARSASPVGLTTIDNLVTPSASSFSMVGDDFAVVRRSARIRRLKGQ